MASILEKIVDQTKSDLQKKMREISFRELESFERYEKKRTSFKDALKGEDVSIIAEIKKASPSKGLIRADFDPVKLAGEYQENGADAISILTDKPFFQGELKFLEDISEIATVPLLRKDFIVDPYQVKEARAYGADAVLLIVTVTQGKQLKELLHACKEFGMQALVECYGKEDLEQLNWAEVEILGVNNRDLHTFEVNIHRGIDLLRKSPDHVVRVSESGISSAEDLVTLNSNEIDAALIGEFFMRQPAPGKSVKNLKEEFKQKLIKRD